jgi:hypothetical protein
MIRIETSALRSKVALASIACMSSAYLATTPAAQAAADETAGPSAEALAQSMIVDCLLPGAVRKLGSQATFLTPRRVLRLAVKECEVRGGEYVLYDRSDPAQALKIWKPAADQGDAMAEYRLGQIYEIGLAGNPDYVAAARWYEKASVQGNRAATLNLAVLYESGRGVEHDQAAAQRLYRKAQGLSDGSAAKDDEAKLRQELKAAKDRIERLEGQLRQQRDSGQQPSSQTEKELQESQAVVDKILAERTAPLDLVLDVGAGAGARPSIQLIDPSRVLTRGITQVSLPDSIKVRQIVGRVRSRAGLRTLTVDGKEVQPDRFGFFSADIPVSRAGTMVTIVAIDRQGERDKVSLELKTRTAVEPPRQPFAGSETRALFGSYHALIIGNDHYPNWGDLTTPVNDANSVADVLRDKYGFKTTVLLNATRTRILNALNDLVKTLGPQDNLLIYYAGHGHYESGVSGYWIPVDAEIDRDTQWILNVYVTNELLKMNAKSILVVSDSCYSGTLTESASGAVPTIREDIGESVRRLATERLSEVPSRTVLTSGALQPVWDAGIGGNSLFAHAFLDVLRNNNSVLEGYRLYEEVEGRVVKSSQKIREREKSLGRTPAIQSDQTPLYAAIQHAGHQGGDFVFVPVK